MSVIRGSIALACEPATVFDYVTRPETWTEWYPLTRSVSGTVDRTPEPGEIWHEVIQIGPLRRRAEWKTVRCDRPHEFAYVGRGQKGGDAQIDYSFEEQDGKTLFRRELRYNYDSWLLRLFDVILTRRLIQRASDKALQNLVTKLEQG